MFRICAIRYGFHPWRKQISTRTHKQVTGKKEAVFDFGKVRVGEGNTLELVVRKPSIFGGIACTFMLLFGFGRMKTLVNGCSTISGKPISLKEGDNRLVLRLFRPNGNVIEKGRVVIKVAV